MKSADVMAENACPAFEEAFIIAYIWFVASWADIPIATNCAFSCAAYCTTLLESIVLKASTYSVCSVFAFLTAALNSSIV